MEITADTLFTVLGIIGACCAVSAYFLLEISFFRDDSVGFYALNAIGAALVIAGLIYDFDGGDWGAMGQEACWIAISVTGVVRKTLRKRMGHILKA